jgi:serine/threonine-protein kinase RsbW
MQKLGKLRVKAALENVPVAMDFVVDAARSVGLDGQVLHQIQLVVDEACANVVDHAYDGLERGDMEVSCHLDDRDFVICVRDWGRGFDPDGVPDPDVTAALEERTLGGLGLFLIRQFMDRVQYSSDPAQGNELLMSKGIDFGD